MSSNYKAIRINNVEVHKVPQYTSHIDNRPVKGGDLFSEIYANIFLCAKKKSGKTSVIYKILKECCGKKTRVVAFVSTLYKDDSWKSIRQYCRTKGIDFEGHTSLIEDGIDKLEELIDELKDEAKEEFEEEQLEERISRIELSLSKRCPIQTDYDIDEEENEEKKVKREKYKAPEIIIVLDDLSNQLKSKTLVCLLKNNRHFKSKIILSSQYLNDLLPEARKQLDYFLLFRGQPVKKLEEIHRDADVHIDFEEFCDIYKFATEKPYSFLYIDTNNCEFRRNFNYVINIA